MKQKLFSMVAGDRSIFCLFLIYLSGLIFSHPAQAQIVPDTTLGDENSVITSKDLTTDLIEGGAIRHNNLFHSFRDFNVNNGNAVYFASPDGITNILTRVTGSNVSNIFGRLGVEGTANLFLLNPNGIIFGDRASLDVSGSFLATTANSYIFNSADAKFSATDPQNAPLLSVDLTPGLQMGANSQKIVVQNNGHLLFGGVFFPFQNNSSASGLQIDRGETLSLIGSGLQLDGGIIKTLGGNIELASIKQGEVEIDLNATGNILNTSEIQEFGDIKLSNQSLLDGSGVFSSNIALQGKNIIFEDASVAIIQNFGLENLGKINLKANKDITLSGTVRNSPDIPTPQGSMTGVISSRITTETLGGSQSSNIFISGKNLLLKEGSSIFTRSFSSGMTGDLDVEIAESIEIEGSSFLNPIIPSLLGTAMFGGGDSGTINVVSDRINMLDGGTISSLNFGSGKGGDINIRTGELNFMGVDNFSGSPSTVSSTVYGQGDSSNLTIFAQGISLLDGARVSTATLAEGDAGQLEINATEYIKIAGTTPDGQFESSFASDGEILPTNLRQFLRLPDFPTGNSGNVIVNTPNLILRDSGEVGVSNQGLGDSGSLTINSERVTLDNSAEIAAFSTSGQGGNIELNVNDFLFLTNSQILADTEANFISDRSINGGNININTNIVTLLGNSEINANATEGNGGNINIAAQGLFVSPDSLISASSKFGLDGNIEIETINSDRPIELLQLPENPIDLATQITTGCSKQHSFIVAGKGGLPENPTQNLPGYVTWQDLRLPTDNLYSNSQPISHNRDISPNRGIVEAGGWQINSKGKVELFALINIDARLPNNNSLQCR